MPPSSWARPVKPGPDSATTGRRIAEIVQSRGLPRGRLKGALRTIMEAYHAAMQHPDGYAKPGGSPLWKTIPTGEFASLQRGITLQALFRCVWYLGQMLGSPDAAIQLGDDIAQACETYPGLPEFFRFTGNVFGAIDKQSSHALGSSFTTTQGCSAWPRGGVYSGCGDDRAATAYPSQQWGTHMNSRCLLVALGMAA